MYKVYDHKSMKELVVYRNYTYGDSGVLGRLWHGHKFLMYTLEDPWIENRRRISCIPEGRYLCKYKTSSPSGRLIDVYLLVNVPGRSGIFIHSGNTIEDTHGCPLVGMEWRVHPGEVLSISRSREAMNRLHELTGRNDFYLTIKT